MKVTVERDALAPALDTAFACVQRKGTIPVLSCFRLTSAAKSLRIAATDMDSSIEVTIPAEVAKAGEIAVNAEALRSIVRNGPAGAQVGLEAEPSRAALRIARSRYNLPIAPLIDYPEGRKIGAADRTVIVDVGEADVARLFARPAPFIDPGGGTRWHLAGAWLHVHDGRLWSIGADPTRCIAIAAGHRDGCPDAEAFVFADPGGEMRTGIVIPTSTLDGLRRALAQGGRIETNGRTILAEGGGVRFASGLLINQFPPIWRIVDDNTHRIEVDRAEMVTALKRLDAVNSKTARVEMEAAPGAEMLTLRLALSAEGEGEESIRLAHPPETSFGCAFQLPILSLVVNAFAGDTIALSHSEQPRIAGKAFNVRFDDPRDPGAIAVAASLTSAKSDQTAEESADA